MANWTSRILTNADEYESGLNIAGSSSIQKYTNHISAILRPRFFKPIKQSSSIICQWAWCVNMTMRKLQRFCTLTKAHISLDFQGQMCLYDGKNRCAYIHICFSSNFILYSNIYLYVCIRICIFKKYKTFSDLICSYINTSVIGKARHSMETRRLLGHIFI